MVTLFEGCWGKRRDGEIVGPLSFDTENEYPFEDENGISYAVDGCYYRPGKISALDIIEVYPSGPRVKVQEPSPFNLTTREQWRWWFAGNVITGLLSSNRCVHDAAYAELAVSISDLLIEQLEKGKGNV